MCVKREIWARTLPVVHLAPAVLVPSRGDWVQWAEREWVTCLARCVQMCLSFLGRRGRGVSDEGIPPPPDLGQGMRGTGEIPPARGPGRGCLQSLQRRPGSSPRAPRRHSLGELEGKTLFQVQTLDSRDSPRASTPAADPTQRLSRAPLLHRHPNAKHRKLPLAAWAY